MLEWIFIIGLSVVVVSLMVYEVLMSKKHEEELGDADQEISVLLDKYSAAQKTITELNSNFASSIDVHSKAYDDILVRCKKLELELSEKEAEIIKLQARLYSFNDVINIDTSKGSSDSEGGAE